MFVILVVRLRDIIVVVHHPHSRVALHCEVTPRHRHRSCVSNRFKGHRLSLTAPLVSGWVHKAIVIGLFQCAIFLGALPHLRSKSATSATGQSRISALGVRRVSGQLRETLARF